MPSPAWSYGGRILFNASRVYYIPDEPALPPLRWMPERQRFEYLRRENDEDVALRASLAELSEACFQLYPLQPVQQQSPAASLSGYLQCEALYGILPLGAENNSALLYVTEKEYVCTLAVGGATHDVFAVRGLQWLFLPCSTSALSGRQQRGERQRRRRRSSSDPDDKGAATANRESVAGTQDGDTARAGRGRRGGGGGDAHRDGDDLSGTDDGEEEEEDDEEEEDEDDVSSANESDVVGRLPTKTLYDYLAVLNSFCEAATTEDGGRRHHRHARTGAAAGGAPAAGADAPGAVEERTSQLPGIAGPPAKFSYLYYSPTLDLSADPVHLLSLITRSSPLLRGDGADVTNGSMSSNPHRESSGSATESSDPSRPSRRARQGGAAQAWEERRAAAITRQLYQWNSPILSDALAVPTLMALREENAGACAGSKTNSPGLAPWSCVCADDVLRDELAQWQRRGSGSGSGTSVPASAAPLPAFSSLPLYVPAFIRGLVAQTEASPEVSMTLVTRLCCRWAGTRYNRRGLEPGHSGVAANMAMTSLWVTPQTTGRGASPGEPRQHASVPRPFAVYSILRGSVPRRWEQPANLAHKPTIKISPVGNAAEELGRHVRLLKQCVPQLRALYCLDTMSPSPLEEPLSEAFAAAVRRYNEEPPSPSLSSKGAATGAAAAAAAAAALEEREGSGAGNVSDAAGAVHAAAARDPTVVLVKFNVKSALRRLTYAGMARECVAALDNAAGADSWLDFTAGEAWARVSPDDETFRTGAPLESPCGGSQAGAEPEEGHRDGAPRLSLGHVQSRLVRVNCLDCLDRTNLVQSVLCCAVLPRMLEHVAGPAGTTTTTTPPNAGTASHRLRLLLAAQGMAISQLYAGTEPHFVPYMLDGHHHWSHKAVEGVLALRRWYQQNFFDGVKQDGVALVTRQHDPQVFNADIESPFSRDLSSMNYQVLYGLLLGVVPFLYSLFVCVSERGDLTSSVVQLHAGIAVCWVVYLSVLYNKVMRYRVTYTNRPLLLYTRQADWC